MYATLKHGTTTAIFNGRIPAEYAAFEELIKTCIRSGWDFQVSFSRTVERIL